MKLFIGVFSLLIFFSANVNAQSKKKKSKKEATQQYAPSSRDAWSYDDDVASSKKNKKQGKAKSPKKQKDLIEEFHQRMKDNAKKYSKRDRQMKKPQYSDPSYFGHKRKPKKRKPGKKKFCKECKLVH